jgi:hypothetical protein
MALSQGRPIIHKLDDPTGIGKIRARCLREFGSREAIIEPQIKALIKTTLEQSLVEVVQVNEVVLEPKAHIVNRAQYVYELSPDRVNQVDKLIKNIIYRQMLGFEEPIWSLQWWFNTYTRQSVEKGYSDSLQSAQNLSPASVVGQEVSAEIRSIDIEQILNQPYYRRRLENVYGRTFNSMVGFGDDTAKQLSGILARAVTSGVNYRAIASELTETFKDMSGYRALRIVRTELNKSATDAYMQNTEDLNRDVYSSGGFRVAVMHLSALAPNTRRTHASRHGDIFTPTEQAEWWDSGSNRVQCQCSVVDVLVDKKTGEVLQTSLHQKAAEQGKEYFKEVGTGKK